MLYLLIERVFDYNYFIKCFSECKIKSYKSSIHSANLKHFWYWHTIGFDTLVCLTLFWFWHTFCFDTHLVLTHFLFWHNVGIDTLLFVCERERLLKNKIVSVYCWPLQRFYFICLVWFFLTIEFFWIFERQI